MVPLDGFEGTFVGYFLVSQSVHREEHYKLPPVYRRSGNRWLEKREGQREVKESILY